jgi:hypothetical protein
MGECHTFQRGGIIEIAGYAGTYMQGVAFRQADGKVIIETSSDDSARIKGANNRPAYEIGLLNSIIDLLVITWHLLSLGTAQTYKHSVTGLKPFFRHPVNTFIISYAFASIFAIMWSYIKDSHQCQVVGVDGDLWTRFNNRFQIMRLVYPDKKSLCTWPYFAFSAVNPKYYAQTIL